MLLKVRKGTCGLPGSWGAQTRGREGAWRPAHLVPHGLRRRDPGGGGRVPRRGAPRPHCHFWSGCAGRGNLGFT